MTDVGVSSPPATGEWWDPEETLESVLLQLRLIGGDVDEGRVAALIPAAGLLIDNWLDREVVVDGPPPHPILQAELERVTISLYHGIEPDPIGDGNRLVAFKERWAVA